MGADLAARGLSSVPMKLYNYFRSSASFRVRIALQLKGLPYDYVPVHIAKGEHKKDGYASISSDTLVLIPIENFVDSEASTVVDTP